MARLQDSRLRTGAVRWGLYRDGADRTTFVELFVVPSWEEHLRQHHERLTGTDRDYERQVTALVDNEDLHHLISVRGPAGRRLDGGLIATPLVLASLRAGEESGGGIAPSPGSS